MHCGRTLRRVRVVVNTIRVGPTVFRLSLRRGILAAKGIPSLIQQRWLCADASYALTGLPSIASRPVGQALTGHSKGIRDCFGSIRTFQGQKSSGRRRRVSGFQSVSQSIDPVPGLSALVCHCQDHDPILAQNVKDAVRKARQSFAACPGERRRCQLGEPLDLAQGPGKCEQEFQAESG